MFYSLEPEVAGGMGPGTELDASVHPPAVTRLNYVFDGWLGDDLLETFPCYILSDRGRRGIEELAPSGVSFEAVTITKGDQFFQADPRTPLPKFWWLKPLGRPGVDDIGSTPSGRLVVSQRILQELKRWSLDHCLVRPYP